MSEIPLPDPGWYARQWSLFPRRRNAFGLRSAAIILVVVLLIAAPFALISVYILWTALAFGALISGAVLIQAQGDRRRTERQLAHHYYGCTLRVDDGGVELETKVSCSRYCWEAFERAWRGDGVLFLQTTLGQFLLLPTGSPDPDLSKQLADWIESSLPVTPEQIKLPLDPGPSDFTPDDASDSTPGDDAAEN